MSASEAGTRPFVRAQDRPSAAPPDTLSAAEGRPDTFGVLLDPSRVTFRRSPAGTLQCEVRGDCCYLAVRATRCFPFSDPDHYIAIVYGKMEEVGVIRHLRELDPHSRQLIQEDLQRRYFVPVITEVISLREQDAVSYWEVETDRGRREFIVRGMREALAELGEDRLLITDVDGNRFEVPDYTQLMGAPFALLNRYL